MKTGFHPFLSAIHIFVGTPKRTLEAGRPVDELTARTDQPREMKPLLVIGHIYMDLAIYRNIALSKWIYSQWAVKGNGI